MATRKIFLALMGLFALGAAAQSPATVPDGSTLTLEQCRELALHNNKDLRKSAQQIKVAGYEKDQAFAAYLPALDFAGGYMYNQKGVSVLGSDQLLPIKNFDLEKKGYEFSFVKNPMTGEPVMVDGKPIPEQVAFLPKEALSYDLHNVFFGAVTLTQPIFMGGKIVAMNKITGYAEELARAMHDNAAQDVVYAVDAAYWLVVSLKAKQKLAVSYVNLLDTLSHNVALMVEQGVATKRDQLTVDVKLNSAQVDLTKVDNGLVLSRMALAQVCGLPVHSVFTLADEDAGSMTAMNGPAEKTYDMQDVYAAREDLRALEYGVKIYKEKENVARASMMPNLALVGSYSFSNPNMFDGFQRKFSGMFSVGAMLTVPIWHWGGNYNKLRAAKAQTVAARLELDNAKELVDLQVNQASFKAQEAVKTYKMTETNLAKADENLRCADLGFRDGVMTVDNVMEAQTAWLKAHSENVDARIDVYLCDVYLNKVLGRLDVSAPVVK
ncbi:MAG: TolC family protein [Duncaniella sp.]|nr:TolC family protein [Bacteroides sp.]MDE5827022.1 TolC family protein [Duncaniella sp.]MDE6061284.1 TolC family protein [Duncaniella sp.]MDE6431309.1 TolC family protein [Duncaniella sp.]MDE7475466.1 TolC family protein [Duncaniella sp.]